MRYEIYKLILILNVIINSFLTLNRLKYVQLIYLIIFLKHMEYLKIKTQKIIFFYAKVEALIVG